jgi:integrase/recombinase XerD
LALRDKTNDELFSLYQNELVLRLNNPKNVRDHELILAKFHEYLGEFPPSAELAKQFLTKFKDRAARTRYRYTQMLKGFMKWYGQPLDDIKVKVPKSLPSYVEDADVEKLLAAIGDKRSHNNLVIRDRLLIEVAWRAGLRRAELANLKVQDIHEDSLFVRAGKGLKDRMIPLTTDIAHRLNKFIKGKGPGDSVFGLVGPSITMKIKLYARKAGLGEDFHAHSLRHKYGTDLLEAGANIRAVQMLMGHENLNTTEVYLSVTDAGLRQAVNKLEGVKPQTDLPQTGRLERSFSIQVEPAEYDPLKSATEPAPTGVFFEVAIPSASVLVEGIQVRTSDPDLPFQLMVFENNPGQTNHDLEQEDIIQMEPVSRRSYNYSPGVPVKYINQEGSPKLFGAIVVYQRPLPVALLSESKRAALLEHLQQPAKFSITLEYCCS